MTASSFNDERSTLLEALGRGDFAEVISLLSPEQQTAYESEFYRRKKSTSTAYLYYFVLTPASGAHKFYLGKFKWGYFYIVMSILVPTFVIFCLFWVLGAALDSSGLYAGRGQLLTVLASIEALLLATLYFADLLTMSQQVERVNERIQQQVVCNILGINKSNLIASQGYVLRHTERLNAYLSFAMLALVLIGIWGNADLLMASLKGLGYSFFADVNGDRATGDSMSSKAAMDASLLVSEVLAAQHNLEIKQVDILMAKMKKLPRRPVIDSVAAKNKNEEGNKAVQFWNYAQALKSYANAVKLDPTTAEYLINLGIVETKVGLSVEAQDHLQKAIVLEPNQVRGWTNLGLVFADNPTMQASAVDCFLVSEHIDRQSTIQFVQSLTSDRNDNIRQAAKAALKKINML